MDHRVYKHDIMNRFDGEFFEEQNGGMHFVKFQKKKTGVMYGHNGMTLEIAYKLTRNQILDGREPFCITTGEQAELLDNDIPEGFPLYNLDEEQMGYKLKGKKWKSDKIGKG